jgi:hypothetical protein
MGTKRNERTYERAKSSCEIHTLKTINLTYAEVHLLIKKDQSILYKPTNRSVIGVQAKQQESATIQST